MNVTFITMTFGIGIPLLFPIAATYFAVMYFLEKYKVIYVSRIPPLFDSTLYDQVLIHL